MQFSTSLIANLLLTTTIHPVSAQEGTTAFHDTETGITFASYTQTNGISFRIALPQNSTSSDAIFQISSPATMAWCGLAWGGHMTNNPLSVTWPTGTTSGDKVLVSSRMAFGYYAIPQPYDSALYTILHTSSSSSTNGTWSITARCQGCTKWSSADGDIDIQNEGTAILAYGCSSKAPETPSSNSSSFDMHEVFGIWQHDLGLGRNATYGSWVGGGAGEEGGLGRRWVA